MADLLLHSMSNFKEIISQILDKVCPKIIVEIGCEYAGSTFQFLEYCKKNDAFLYIVDPSPFVDVQNVLKNYSEYYEFIEEKSLDALKNIKKADLYIVDGDHNYWTVINELNLIFENNSPVVIIHDVGYPCSRRDLYYNPTNIPKEYLHTYTYDHGTNIKDELILRGGFHGAGYFAFSTETNKEKMGVLTAIEDFMKYHPNLTYQSIPLIFGLGFIAHTNKFKIIEDFIKPYQIELMYEIERNRMELYLKVLSLQSDLDELRRSKLVRFIEKMGKK